MMDANDVFTTDAPLMFFSTSPTASASMPSTSLRDAKPFILAPRSFTAGSSTMPKRSLGFQRTDVSPSAPPEENVLEKELRYVEPEDDVLFTRMSTLSWCSWESSSLSCKEIVLESTGSIDEDTVDSFLVFMSIGMSSSSSSSSLWLLPPPRCC